MRNEQRGIFLSVHFFYVICSVLLHLTALDEFGSCYSGVYYDNIRNLILEGNKILSSNGILSR
jgi:hypothetical protein